MANWVEVGKVLRPFKLNGLVKIKSYTTMPRDIFKYNPWYIGSEKVNYSASQTHPNATHLIAKLGQVNDPDQAASLCGMAIYIKKSQLPELDDNEFYWHEVTNFSIYNNAGKQLGVLKNISEHNGTDIATIQTESNHEVLVPLVTPYLVSLDKQNKRIIIDWPDEDFNN